MKPGIRHIALLTGVVAIVGWYAAGLLAGTESRTARQMREIEQMEHTLATLASRKHKVERLDRQIADAQNVIAALEQRLPIDTEHTRLLDTIRRAAEANSLQAHTINALPIAHAKPYSERSIEIGLNGDFFGVYGFLQQLEQLPRPMRITRLRLERAAESDAPLKADVTLSYYINPSPETATQLAAGTGH